MRFFLIFGIIGLVVNCLPQAEAGLLENLKFAVSKYLVENREDWKGSRIEVDLVGAEGILAKLEAQYPKANFRVDKNYALAKVTPKAVLPILVLVNGTEKNKINLYIKARVYKKVVSASRKIARGELINVEQLEVCEKEISLAPVRYYTKKDELKGKKAYLTIPPGDIVFEWMVKTVPDIARGSVVRILAEAPGIKIEASGIALEDGKIGDKIKVHRENIKAYLRATVVSSKEVEIAI